MNEIIIGGNGITVYGIRGQHPVYAGEVAIIGERGCLLCICKNDPELIKLSIFSHSKEG